HPRHLRCGGPHREVRLGPCAIAKPSARAELGDEYGAGTHRHAHAPRRPIAKRPSSAILPRTTRPRMAGSYMLRGRRRQPTSSVEEIARVMLVILRRTARSRRGRAIDPVDANNAKATRSAAGWAADQLNPGIALASAVRPTRTTRPAGVT